MRIDSRAYIMYHKQMNKEQFKSNLHLVGFLFMKIISQKRWWLLPLLLILLFLGIFVSVTGNSSVLPAIYALF
ncbi:MAG: DUF5989 family protein [Candidatus Omnitrophica bacterium]|nr:DUF5989 family protein [Candidatus Omnitrophota bacterium]